MQLSTQTTKLKGTNKIMASKKKVMKICRFSDGSIVIDSIDGIMADQHVFCNPGLGV